MVKKKGQSAEYKQWLAQGKKRAVKAGIKRSDYYAKQYADYMQMAKLADQKARRLEKLANEDGWKNATRYAYARAQKDLKKWATKEKDIYRFSAEVPTTISGLAAKQNDLERFMYSSTSDKTSIKQIYVKMAESINDKYGRDPITKKPLEGWTDLTWSDVTNYYAKTHHEKEGKKMGGSETQMAVLGRIKSLESKDKKKQAQNIQEIISGSKTLTDDEVVNYRIKQLLKEGIKPEDLFKK